jgi:hypothetical protein
MELWLDNNTLGGRSGIYLADLSFFLWTNENGHDDLSKLRSFEKRKLGSQQSFHGWPKATLLHFYKELDLCDWDNSEKGTT